MKYLILMIIFISSNSYAENIGKCQDLSFSERTNVTESIFQAGYYCLSRDISAPLFYIPHMSPTPQNPLIDIYSSDVIVDLKSRKLIGGFFSQSDYLPIKICEKCKNITIKNGEVVNFSRGIEVIIYGEKFGTFKRKIIAKYNKKTNTYTYDPLNITVQGVAFKNVQYPVVIFEWTRNEEEQLRELEDQKQQAKLQQSDLQKNSVLHCFIGVDALDLDAGKREIQSKCAPEFDTKRHKYLIYMGWH